MYASWVNDLFPTSYWEYHKHAPLTNDEAARNRKLTNRSRFPGEVIVMTASSESSGGQEGLAASGVYAVELAS
jgi:hypothetical protein